MEDPPFVFYVSMEKWWYTFFFFIPPFLQTRKILDGSRWRSSLWRWNGDLGWHVSSEASWKRWSWISSSCEPSITIPWNALEPWTNLQKSVNAGDVVETLGKLQVTTFASIEWCMLGDIDIWWSKNLGGVFKHFCIFTPNPGKMESNLTLRRFFPSNGLGSKKNTKLW